jgi:hypothetical protein
MRWIRSISELAAVAIVLVVGVTPLVHSSSIEGLAINTYDALVLNSLSINAIAD